MSLINEALKRAEADKANRTSADPTAPQLPPVLEDAERPRRSRVLTFLILSLMAGGAWSGYQLYRAHGLREAQAAAKPEPQAQPPAARNRTPAATKPRKSFDPEIELAFSRTMQALRNYEPSTRPSANRTQPPGRSAPARPREVPAATSARAAPAPAAPKTRPPQTASAPMKTGPPQPDRPKPRAIVHGSRYKLTGVMQAPAGATAIINGSFVRAGQTIDGATVVRIHDQSAELEIQGRRFTIRM